MKRTYYTQRQVVAVRPEFVYHRTVRVKKSDITVKCSDCGAERVLSFDGQYHYHDTKTGKRVTITYYKFLCPNKRWYHFIKHWCRDEHKVVESR